MPPKKNTRARTRVHVGALQQIPLTLKRAFLTSAKVKLLTQTSIGFRQAFIRRCCRFYLFICRYSEFDSLDSGLLDKCTWAITVYSFKVNLPSSDKIVTATYVHNTVILSSHFNLLTNSQQLQNKLDKKQWDIILK